MKIKDFTKKHKIISFLIVLISTVIISRMVIFIGDPDIIIAGFELHHFYYGLTILVIASILMLYRRSNFQTNLLLTGIGIGLIIDEAIFVMGKMPNEKYISTWPSVTVAIIIILLITEFVFYKTKRKKY
jgi:hypothetical protein